MGLSVRNEPISQRPAKAIARVQQGLPALLLGPEGTLGSQPGRGAARARSGRKASVPSRSLTSGGRADPSRTRR
jgi:hypothetical protein